MNRKSLALLLVVALLAMMVPSFALAAGTVTASLSSSDWKHSLTRTERIGGDGTALATGIKVEMNATEGIIPVIYWESSDTNIAYPVTDHTDFETGKTTQDLPDLVCRNAGTVTITGKVYDQTDLFDVLQTLTLSVTLEVVKETAVTFTPTSFKAYVNNGFYPTVTVLPDDSTYGVDELQWSVSDPKIIRVDNDGWVTPLKAGTADVIATAKGSGVVGKASVTVYEQGEGTENAFKTIQFSTKEIEISEGRSFTLYPHTYLTLDPDPNARMYTIDDDLNWSVSNPSIASVESGDKYYSEIYVSSSCRVGDTVVVTAASKLNPDLKDTITLVVVETVPYKKIAFKEKTLTLKKLPSSAVYMADFLAPPVKEKGKITDDDIIYTSSDPEKINVGKYDSTLELKRPGTVTITARSLRKPDEVFDTITVTLEKEKLTKIWFASDAPKQMKYDGSFAVSKYINTEPYYYADYYADEIGWTTSDPQVAYASGNYIYAAGVGKATITAFSKDDESVATATPLALEVLPNPITEVKLAKTEYTVKQGLPLTLVAGKDFKIKPREYSPDFTVTGVSSDPEVVSFVDCEIGNTFCYVNLATNKVGKAKMTLSFRNADNSVVAVAPITVNVKGNDLTGIAFKKKAYTADLTNERNLTSNLYLTLTPADAYIDWSQVYAESSNPDVLEVEKVTSKGKVVVVPKQPGTANVTVTYRENPDLAAATTKVTVKPIQIKKVWFPKKLQKLQVPMYDVEAGSRYEGINEVKVYANIQPANAYWEAKWETSDASVAFVAEKISSNTSSSDDEKPYYNNTEKPEATIVAAGPGSCKIILTLTDGTNTITKKISVTVKKAKVAKLTLNKTKATCYIIKGEENTLQLIATDSKTDFEVPVTWKTSNKKVATVDKTGLVKFVGAGKATITATTRDGNKTAKKCTLTIKKLKVTSVTPAKKTLTMKVGQEQTLKVTVKPAKAYNSALSFKSSKPKIVSVDAEGNVKALALGKAVITITAKDGSKKSCKVTITVKPATKTNGGIEITGDDLDLTIDGDLLDGLDGIDDLTIGDDVMDIDGAITNVTIE